MTNNTTNQTEKSRNFEILFEKMDETININGKHLFIDYLIDPEIDNTISLFNEYLESITEQSYSTVTVA